MCVNRGGERSDRRNADVRPGAGRGARRCQHDHGQAEIAEHEADQAARQSRDEAPGGDRDEEERVQALEYRA